MKFALIIYSPPAAPGSTTALLFAQTLLAQGHELYRVFFYGDGVSNGAEFATELADQWSQLARQHEVDLVLCATAAEQRGIRRAAAGFQFSGLGQLVDAVANSDRCLTFR